VVEGRKSVNKFEEMYVYEGGISELYILYFQ
jgi:hypothetical protein